MSETYKDHGHPPGWENEHDPRCQACAISELASSGCSPSGVEAAVCADIAERQQKGIEKYGVTVADNPLKLKEWLQHAYEETLDKAIYLKRAIVEMENTKLAD
jgi:hypothetical protein